MHFSCITVGNCNSCRLYFTALHLPQKYTLERVPNEVEMQKRMERESHYENEAVLMQKICNLEVKLQRSEKKVAELEMENSQISQELDRLVMLPECTVLMNTLIQGLVLLKCVHVCNSLHI